MKLFEKKPDVGKDFNHLFIVLSMYQDSAIDPLIDILENCLKDPAYKKIAIDNLIYFASTEKVIKENLEKIIHSEDEEFMRIKPLCEKILEGEENKSSPNLTIL